MRKEKRARRAVATLHRLRKKLQTRRGRQTTVKHQGDIDVSVVESETNYKPLESPESRLRCGPMEWHCAARAATVLRRILPAMLCTNPLVSLPRVQQYRNKPGRLLLADFFASVGERSFPPNGNRPDLSDLSTYSDSSEAY